MIYGELLGVADGDGDVVGLPDAVAVAAAEGDVASVGIGLAPGVIGAVAVSSLSVR